MKASIKYINKIGIRYLFNFYLVLKDRYIRFYRALIVVAQCAK